MSIARRAWILGVFLASLLAALAISEDGFVGWVAALLSVPVVVVIHEAGHAVAAMAVGYRVTHIGLDALGDAVTDWEPGRSEESFGRTVVSLAAGPAVTMLAAIGILVFGPWHGLIGAWGVGLATFTILWTLDIVAPIPRVGVQRDGYAIAQLVRARRAEEGNYGSAMNQILGAVDEVVRSGEARRARAMALSTLDKEGADIDPHLWAALVSRLVLADIALGQASVAQDGCVAMITDAIRLSPRDPLVAAIARRLGLEVPEGQRRATPAEVRLIGVADARSDGPPFGNRTRRQSSSTA